MLLEKLNGTNIINFHFIKHPLKQVDAELGPIIFDTLNRKWKTQYVSLDLESVLDFFNSELNFKKEVKCLMWQPKSVEFDLVVFITSLSDGWPTLINKYFSIHQRESISVTFTPTLIEFPMFAFAYKNHICDRVIQVIKEERKWTFFEKGTLLSFEDEENYKKKKIVDRLNNSIIIEYLQRNDININESDFWKPKNIALEFYTNLENH